MREHAAMFGPEPQKYGFAAANFEKLRASPKTGLVMLSGDMVRLRYSWTYRVVPSFNFDIARGVNHDREQHARIPKAPAFVR